MTSLFPRLGELETIGITYCLWQAGKQNGVSGLQMPGPCIGKENCQSASRQAIRGPVDGICAGA